MMRTLSVLSLALWLTLSWPPDGQQSLLERGRAAIGGDALRRVRSLSVDFTQEGAGMDFRLPDGFRLRTGPVAHILEGPSFRQSVQLPDAVKASAHARTEFTFAVNAIKYLLAAPAVLDIAVASSASRTVEGVGQVDVVTFEGQRGFTFDLFLHHSTHMPVGSEYAFPMEGGVLERVKAEYGDYREVDGVKFPFVTKGSQRGHSQTTTVSAIRVNPDLRGVFERD
jgi:hypothetical protein